MLRPVIMMASSLERLVKTDYENFMELWFGSLVRFVVKKIGTGHSVITSNYYQIWLLN